MFSCDSDDEGVNPMVSGFQDDLDSEDEMEAPKPVISAKPKISAQDIDLTSDEEEEEDTTNHTILQPISVKPQQIPNFKPVKSSEHLPKFNTTDNASSSVTVVSGTTLSKESSSASLSKYNNVTADDSDSDSDQGAPPVQIAVLGDADVSDDDDNINTRPVDSGLATDSTQVNTHYMFLVCFCFSKI